MIAFPAGTKVWIAGGVTDMRNYAAAVIMRSPEQPCQIYALISE